MAVYERKALSCSRAGTAFATHEHRERVPRHEKGQGLGTCRAQIEEVLRENTEAHGF